MDRNCKKCYGHGYYLRKKPVILKPEPSGLPYYIICHDNIEDSEEIFKCDC